MSWFKDTGWIKIMQTIRRHASQFQSEIYIISKPCLISSEIKEAHNIMKSEEKSIRNDRNTLVSQLRQLVEYYMHSYKLKGLEENLPSGPNNNIISIKTFFWWIFLLSLKTIQIQGIYHCQFSSCIYGKNTRKKNMYGMLRMFWTFIKF